MTVLYTGQGASTTDLSRLIVGAIGTDPGIEFPRGLWGRLDHRRCDPQRRPEHRPGADRELIAGVSSVIAATNRECRRDRHHRVGEGIPRRAEQIKSVSQGVVTRSLGEAARGEVAVAAVVAANTGEALKAQVQAAVISPSLLVPRVVVAEATGTQGPQVLLQVAANDIAGQSLPVVLSHASGSTFTLGDTIVIASTTDQLGNTSTATFTVMVVDTTAPDLLLPEELVFEATGPEGEVVAFPTVVCRLARAALSATISLLAAFSRCRASSAFLVTSWCRKLTLL